MPIETEIIDGVGVLTINAPPVNALDNAGWKEFAATMTALGENPDVNCVVIRAEGKGFQCGVDVKELAEDGSLIVELNKGCYDSFAAVYDCPVPTISAVNGFCIGGGLGIAGASDFVIAADDSTYCLPEIDRGALGAATHLMRMVGVQKARRMLYTCETIDAEELFSLGGCTEIVPLEKLKDHALDVARQIAGKSPKALRLGKQALNGIELLEPKTSYRYEQGFTLELYTTPDSQEARDAFVEKRDAKF